MSTTTTSTVGRRSPMKIVGSIAVVGAAVAVAGLGTFGEFTASTAAVDAGVDTGVLSIDVTLDGNPPPPFAVPLPNLLPGDAISVPLDLRNSGDVDLSSVKLVSRATTSSLLDTEAVHGLQLNVDSCATPWVSAGANSYTCTGGAAPLYSGRIVADTALPGARSLVAGTTDHLLATVSFPTTGDPELQNQMQNQQSTFEFVFTATQRDGAAR